MPRLPAAFNAIRAALLAMPILVAAARPASAHRPQPVDSAGILLRQGADARREGRAASLRSAIALWARAEDAARATGNRRAVADALYLRGGALEALSVLDTAEAALDSARALRKEAGDAPGLARALAAQALVDFDAGRTDRARARADTALALRPRAGGRAEAAWDAAEADARMVLVRVLWRTAEPAAAFRHLRRVLALRRRMADRPGEAEAVMQWGYTLWGLAQPDSALVFYRRAAAIQRREGDTRGLAWAYRESGLVFSTQERRDSQGIYARRALDLFRRAGDRRGEALALTDVAGYHGEMDSAGSDSAMVLLRQALALMRAVGDRWGEVTATAQIGSALEGGQPDSAAAYLAAALAGYRETDDLHGQAWMLEELGGAALVDGKPGPAIPFYRAALEVRHRTGMRADEAALLTVLGQCQGRVGRPDSARADFRRALALMGPSAPPLSRYYLLLDMANVDRHGPGRGGMAAVTALYDSAAWYLARAIARMGADDHQLAFLGDDLGPTSPWTLAWLAREPRVGARRARFSALAAGERGRARTLLQLMQRTGARGREGAIPRPGADLAAEGAALAAGALRGEGAVLVYQLARDSLLRWVLTPGAVPRVFAQRVRSDSLHAWVNAARRSLGADDAALRGVGRRAPPLERPAAEGAGPAAPGMRRLAGLLLPDSVAAALPPHGEVVIVAGGVLGLVPFAALRLPGGEYLGAGRALRYAPSLGAAGVAASRPAPPRAELSAALVVGDPAMPTVTTYTGEEVELDPLPGAAREADEVAARLGTLALHGAAASETAVLPRLARAPLVHLATHGFAYGARERAAESFVALAPGAGNDGLLTVGDILSRPGRMRADLVVLSACQSGLGSVQDAEGTVGLERAFLARGARSVLVSLWSVSDRATEALMRGFYQHWLGDADHPDKAEALRRAQEEVRATPGMESPLYWAAFKLSGAP